MKALAFVFAVAVIGCPPEPHPPPSLVEGGVPLFDADAEPVPATPERAACSRMCEHMETLGCPLGKRTPQRKEPCLSWCTRIQSKHEVDLHPDCIAQVPSCDRVKTCDN